VNRRVLIGVVAGIAVVGLWFVALWKPQQAQIGKAEKRAAAAEQQANDLGLQVSRLQDLKSRTALQQSQLERLRVAIPDQPNLAEFILDANQVATKAGIDFLSITPAQPAAGTPTSGAAGAAPASVHLSMTITGGYYQVVDFLNRVEAMPRIVVLDNVALTAGSGSAQLSVALDGRMFVTKVPDSATAAPTPGATPAAPSAPGATTTTTVAPATTATTLRGA